MPKNYNADYLICYYRYYKYPGGITYFIYTLYLLYLNKNHCSKIIISGLLSFSFATCIAYSILKISFLMFFMIVIINIIINTFLLIKYSKSKNKTAWKTFLIYFILCFILSLFSFFLVISIIALGSLPVMRY